MAHSKDSKNSKNVDQVFFVRIQYRRNTSWQGNIQWINGRKTMVFRSVLELGHLINNAINASIDGNEKDTGSGGWSDKESVS